VFLMEYYLKNFLEVTNVKNNKCLCFTTSNSNEVIDMIECKKYQPKTIFAIYENTFLFLMPALLSKNSSLFVGSSKMVLIKIQNF